MLEILTNPIVIECARWLIMVGVAAILTNVRKLIRRVTYIEYKLEATDHALEKSFDNGYAGYRDKKLKELLDENNFINKSK